MQTIASINTGVPATYISAWQQGLYIVRLVYNGQTVASEKVVVE